MLVCEMRERMPESEYVIWSRYYARVQQRKELANKAAS